jgi:hypothetical protein
VVAKLIAYFAAFNEDRDPSMGTRIFENLVLSVFELDIRFT